MPSGATASQPGARVPGGPASVGLFLQAVGGSLNAKKQNQKTKMDPNPTAWVTLFRYLYGKSYRCIYFFSLQPKHRSMWSFHFRFCLLRTKELPPQVLFTHMQHMNIFFN